MTTKGLTASACGDAAFGRGPGGRVSGHVLLMLASQLLSIPRAPSPALSHESLSGGCRYAKDYRLQLATALNNEET